MSRLLVALHLAWVAACASTPPPQLDPFETAQAAHESPDGQIKLMHALPGTVSLKKSGIGYVVSAKASGMDLTCILGGLAQVEFAATCSA